MFNPEIREAHGKNYAFLALASHHLAEKNLTDFSALTEPLLNGNHSYVVFDLENLDIINSKTMGYFEILHKKLALAKKRLALIQANEEIRDILDFIGLSRLVEIFDEEEMFIEVLREREF
jgi:anti-anti-sigma regulatory factor